jgi:meso-butanediol dehydrogenase/(S,S)-butanediol dehydrogenase/diacetyl reductase
MEKSLEGKIAFITGTSGGQGRAAALAFAAQGAIVVGCDLTAGTHETEELVRASNGQMHSTSGVDLGDPDQARRWVDEGVAEHGGIDVLYNNASAARFGSIATMSDDDWRGCLRNELDLVFYSCRAAWPHLVARGGGSIINTASVVAVSAMVQTPGCFAHAAAKGAVVAMTRELAVEGGAVGIRANCISPGIIESPATAGILEKPVIRDGHLSAVMIKRIGQPEDVASAALYLASDASSWVTGTNMIVDGGFTAW